MSYIVVTRNPASKELIVLHDVGDAIAEFETMDVATVRAKSSRVCNAWGWKIVKLND